MQSHSIFTATHFSLILIVCINPSCNHPDGLRCFSMKPWSPRVLLFLLHATFVTRVLPNIVYLSMQNNPLSSGEYSARHFMSTCTCQSLQDNTLWLKGGKSYFIDDMMKKNTTLFKNMVTAYSFVSVWPFTLGHDSNINSTT